jgi:hypothetical protein
MDSNPVSRPENPLLTPDVRRYLASLGGGWKGWSYEVMSMQGKLLAARKWATRRQRYGPTGQRDKPYAQWCKEHGKGLSADCTKLDKAV